MSPSNQRLLKIAVIPLVCAGIVIAFLVSGPSDLQDPLPASKSSLKYVPRKRGDMSGFIILAAALKPWSNEASLEDVSQIFQRLGYKHVEELDRRRGSQSHPLHQQVEIALYRASYLCYEGKPRLAYADLEEARLKAQQEDLVAEDWLYTLIFCQGVVALRIGEDENCIMCRGESSCIVPIVPGAVHTNAYGSRLAIKHFTEYLEQFPDDVGVRWLLNLSHMTLGEYPSKVDPRYTLNLDGYFRSEFDIGRFRDIGHLVGVNRLNQAGGGIMDDFDGDGLLDIVVTTMDPTEPMTFYRNKGDGTFEDLTKLAGLEKQLGGLNCVQADFDGDGHLDIFICRGAWLQSPIRPSLLRNDGKGHFTDVTREAGLLVPANTIAVSWGDFDNDGKLDLFVCCERQLNKLFRNKGNGTFEDVAEQAGVAGDAKQHSKGAAWIDFDNDGKLDLFVNNLGGKSQLFRNTGDGKFVDIASSVGIDGPVMGFSCWAFDYDNDGFLDIFATSYDRTLDNIVKGLIGQPHDSNTSKLFRNVDGKRFEDVTVAVGLDKCYATMGSNFADLDNDGFLDFYLGTGDPCFSTLVPNRLFKNVGGKRFADISSSSGMGHLQKGHGVACGDWNRDGNVDLFIQMGGASHGDKYHNILFHNPGNKNSWPTVKLIGKQTNRSAIGARIKVVTAGPSPMTIHRHISTGSSFGANPLEQTIGLATAEKIAQLEITWPTSGTKQVFENVPINQAIEVTEFAKEFRVLPHKPTSIPKSN